MLDCVEILDATQAKQADPSCAFLYKQFSGQSPPSTPRSSATVEQLEAKRQDVLANQIVLLQSQLREAQQRTDKLHIQLAAKDEEVLRLKKQLNKFYPVGL